MNESHNEIESADNEFPVETKVKNGFTRYSSNELLFVCDKAGSSNFGYVGVYNLSSNTVTQLYDFPTDLKPKHPPVALQTQCGRRLRARP